MKKKLENLIGNKKKHLEKEERFCIEKLLRQDKNLTEIAQTLGRGLSTISEEVKNNKGRENYTAEKAHRRARLKQNKKKKNCNKIAMDGNLNKFVEKKLGKGWSPEVISARLEIQSGLKYASPKSIRKFIKKRHGLERFLFWKRNKHKSGKKNSKGIFLADKDRKSIDVRPLEALFEYGHWEMDFIVSKFNSFVLLVLIEKFSKKVLLIILPNRKNDLINETIQKLLENYIVKSITTDNDIAFSKWKELEEKLNTKIYFCHPYHSWEKGLVENTNRWIRQFIPKKTDLKLVSEEELKNIEDWFNHTPKVCLSGKTPYEVFIKEECDTIVESLEINLPTKLRIWG
jgi:IS30 family transposase